ncbi:MAG: SPOR domain-containing protein [Magnetococcales bacterium]|nr:SPOR domain-containing protein [Magnetococcales bacterium]
MNEDLLELKRNLIKYHSNAANFVADEKPSEWGSAAHSAQDEQSLYDGFAANYVADQYLEDKPQLHTLAANYVADHEVEEKPMDHNLVTNIVADKKLEAQPVLKAPVSNVVADKKLEKQPVLQSPVTQIVADQKFEEQPVHKDLVAHIVANQRVEEQHLDQVNISQPNIVAEKPTPVFMVEDKIDEQPHLQSIDAEIFARNNVLETPSQPEPTPSSGELMGTGLHLLWRGVFGFVKRMWSGCNNLFSTVWRGIRNFFAMITTSRRPVMEMFIAIPVALLIGYQFKGFNNNQGEVNIPLSPTYSQIQHVQPVVASNTQPKSKQNLALVPQEVQPGVELIRDELSQKVAEWRKNLFDKVAVLQKRSDFKETKIQENARNNSELLVVVKPPKDPLEMYQARLTNNMPITVAAKRAIDPRPVYNRPLQVAPPATEVAVPPPATEVAVPPPVQVVVEQPVQVAAVIPSQVVVERPSQVVVPQPLKIAVKQSVNSAMVTPKPFKKQVAAKVGVPVPRSKLLSQNHDKPTIATPAPILKIKINSIKKRKIVNNGANKPLQVKAKSPKGFVLFLGSYRQSKAEYLQNITDNLQQEPFDLIKQTVQINSASYTRLYAGPFADRDAANVAQKALFASKKINSSVTYLQPGVTKYSRVERSDKKFNSANNSTRNIPARPQVGEKYVIRVGSYQNLGVDSSGNLLRKIASLGGFGFQQGINVKGKTFWRVYSGPFANLQQANQAKEALEEKLSLPNMSVMSKNGGDKWVRIAEANRS